MQGKRIIYTDDDLREAVRVTNNIKQMMLKLGYKTRSSSGVKYLREKIKYLNINTEHWDKPKEISDEEFIEAVKKSYSYADLLKTLGYNHKGGKTQPLKDRILLLNLSTEHFRYRENGSLKPLSTEHKRTKKFKEYLSSTIIKEHLINERGLVCELCELSEWNNHIIPLDVHHINGNHYDNTVTNLLLCCKLCHAWIHYKPNKKQYKKRTKEWYEYADTTILRCHFLKEKNFACEICGLDSWLGSHLPLQIHHINGRHDNHFNSLICTCANCHFIEHDYRLSQDTNPNGFKRCPIIISGVIYESMISAARILGVAKQTIKNRLENVKYPEYQFVVET